MKDEFSVDEIEGVIATIERSRDAVAWPPGYARLLDIELRALHVYRSLITDLQFYRRDA